MFDVNPRSGSTLRHEPNLDIGRIREVLAKMPPIRQQRRRFPRRDLTPVVLSAVRRPLKNSTANSALHDDDQAGVCGHRVISRPPRVNTGRPHRERVLDGTCDVEGNRSGSIA
jgi:hypothetical protein